jgi:hypothetical protein
MDAEFARDSAAEALRPRSVESLLLDLERGPAAGEAIMEGLERGLQAMQAIRARISVHEGT